MDAEDFWVAGRTGPGIQTGLVPTAVFGRNEPAPQHLHRGFLAAIEEATEILRTEGLESPRLTVRTYKAWPAARRYLPGDVRRGRALLGTSQSVLARFLGVSVETVRSWEQGTRPPSAIARRFMDEIEGDPEHWRRRIVQNATGVESKPANR